MSCGAKAGIGRPWSRRRWTTPDDNIAGTIGGERGTKGTNSDIGKLEPSVDELIVDDDSVEEIKDDKVTGSGDEVEEDGDDDDEEEDEDEHSCAELGDSKPSCDCERRPCIFTEK
jgi:hypothetical protein